MLWTRRRFRTMQKERQAFTLIPRVKLEFAISLTCLSLDCGRKRQNPQRTCKLYTERPMCYHCTTASRFIVFSLILGLLVNIYIEDVIMLM